MESSRQGRGDVGVGLGLGLGYTQIETAAECLGRYEIYHVVKEIIGFVLYMHHQIPAILQQLETEFCNMREECKSLESSVLTPTELKATSQRKHNGRMRELKQGIRRLEKLMNAVSLLLSSFQLFLEEIPDIQGLILVLGASLVRPQHVYEMLFSHGKVDSISSKDYTKSRVAEALSRKAIRALISNGASGDSYAGPMKLFLLVKAPANFNLPRHFLPKRDFRYSKKVLPFQLQIKCKTSDQAMDELHSQTASSADQLDPNSNDLIWFQCRHTVKGLASKTSHEEG